MKNLNKFMISAIKIIGCFVLILLLILNIFQFSQVVNVTENVKI